MFPDTTGHVSNFHSETTVESYRHWRVLRSHSTKKDATALRLPSVSGEVAILWMELTACTAACRHHGSVVAGNAVQGLAWLRSRTLMAKDLLGIKGLTRRQCRIQASWCRCMHQRSKQVGILRLQRVQ